MLKKLAEQRVKIKIHSLDLPKIFLVFNFFDEGEGIEGKNLKHCLVLFGNSLRKRLTG